MFDQIKAEVISFWGGDRNAAEAAWASSTDKEKLEARTETDVERVVKGLVTLRHDTPKERIWVEFFITCPIFIERQFDKYRMTQQMQDFEVSYLYAPMGRDNITQNELSGRYRTIPDRPYTTPKDVNEIYRKATGDELAGFWDSLLRREHEEYQFRLSMLREAERAGKITNAEYKRARELLRGVLGTAYLTDMRISMNLNAFEHIVNQRLAADSQTEARILAYHMVKEVERQEIAPTMVQKMIEVNGWLPLLNEVEALLCA